MSELALIVAMTRDRQAIGRAGAMPWHVSEDLKRFKRLTMGHAIIMGRKTHESIGKALPGRRNIVVSRQRLELEGCEVASSLDEAVQRASPGLPFVIGGGELYAQALSRATKLFVTWVDQSVDDADTFFPQVEWSQWRVTAREPAQTSGVEFVDYERLAGAPVTTGRD